MSPLNEEIPFKSRFYATNVLIALDELINASTGGSPHETISSRAWRAQDIGKLWGGFTVPLINSIFELIGDPDHCRRVHFNEKCTTLKPPSWKVLVGIGLIVAAIAVAKH